MNFWIFFYQEKLLKRNGETFETRMWSIWNRYTRKNQLTRNTEIGSGSSRCRFWESILAETDSKWIYRGFYGCFFLAFSIPDFLFAWIFFFRYLLVQYLTLVSLSVHSSSVHMCGFLFLSVTKCDMVTIFCWHYRFEEFFFWNTWMNGVKFDG